MQIKEALELALSVARRMSRDPEAESWAGMAAWHAFKTFKPSLNVPWQAWVTRVTKQHICYLWRTAKRRREVQFSQMQTTSFDETPMEQLVPDANLDSEPMDMSPADWQLLVEHLIEGWPIDVLERRYNLSNRQIRYRLEAVKDEFLALIRLDRRVAYDSIRP